MKRAIYLIILVAVAAAFVIFVLAGILFASLSVKSTGHGPTDVETSAAPT